MFKKVDKSFENIYGIKKVDDKYSFDRPCLLSIFPMVFSEIDANRYLSQILYFLQIRSSKVDSDYTTNDLPFDFFTKEYNEQISSKIIELIPDKDYAKAEELLRNINILSYCNGNKETTKLIKEIYNGLEQKGFSEEEIKQLLKEIFVLQVVDNNYIEKEVSPIPFATTIVIQDIYDMENFSHVEDFNSDNPFISPMQINGTKYLFYKSFGEESLSREYEEREHVFKQDYINAPVINSVMALCIIKAISLSLNNNNKSNISIYDEYQKLIEIADQFIKNKEKDPDELNKEELIELSNMLLLEIRKIFKANINTKLLNDEEKLYLNEKDDIIKILCGFRYDDNIIEQFTLCSKTIEEIENIYNSYGQFEIVREVNNNEGIVGITREDELKNKIHKLEIYLNKMYESISKIKYPDDLSIGIKKGLTNYISFILTNIKEKINDEKFQSIINEINDEKIGFKL